MECVGLFQGWLAVRRQSVGRLGQLHLCLEYMNLGAVDHFFETLVAGCEIHIHNQIPLIIYIYVL